jgi:hypothetical protein
MRRENFSISFDSMRSSTVAVLLATLVMATAATVAACSGRGIGPLGPEYEYEEDLTIGLDGAASMTVNASVPALIALHGLSLNPDPRVRADQLKEQVRQLYSSPYTEVGRISTWSRHGRRFVGVYLRIPDIRSLPKVAPFSWASYELRREGAEMVFKQTLSRPPASAADAGWKGNELVAFRLHLPARIRFHNSRYYDTNEVRNASRGNILTWEQRLGDRLAGKPIAYAQDKKPDVMEVWMDNQSILYRTLWLFALAFVAAVAVLGGVIWLTMRRAPADPPTSSLPR